MGRVFKGTCLPAAPTRKPRTHAMRLASRTRPEHRKRNKGPLWEATLPAEGWFSTGPLGRVLLAGSTLADTSGACLCHPIMHELWRLL